MSKVVFIDEQWFDYEEHDDYDSYEGFSELSVYDIPGYCDGYVTEEDEDGEEDYVEPDRDDYDIVGTVLVGFNDGEGYILEVLDGPANLEYAELYYPPL